MQTAVLRVHRYLISGPKVASACPHRDRLDEIVKQLIKSNNHEVTAINGCLMIDDNVQAK